MKELSSSLNPDLLTRNMRDIVEVIGIRATIRLVSSHGGTRIFMPSRYKTNNSLAAVIGDANVKKLWEVYQGEHVMIDRCEKALLFQRDQEIIAMLNNKIKVADIARKFGLTEMRIYQIQKQHSQNVNSDQMRLI